MDVLEIISEAINWLVLLFIFTRAINTACFSKLDWLFTLVAVAFSYFVKFIVNKVARNRVD